MPRLPDLRPTQQEFDALVEQLAAERRTTNVLKAQLEQARKNNANLQRVAQRLAVRVGIKAAAPVLIEAVGTPDGGLVSTNPETRT